MAGLGFEFAQAAYGMQPQSIPFGYSMPYAAQGSANPGRTRAIWVGNVAESVDEG
ncbi:MAG: hypothetical protein EZS28_052281, partial [Streblomastix strix]